MNRSRVRRGERLVSVVVPTRNSARTIAACLASLEAQTHNALEVIVVDNHSEDATRRVASEYDCVLVSGGPERSAQRNYGARLASGSYLFFVDSDMVVEPTVTEECVRAAESGATAVIIPEFSFGEGFWARCKALERSCYVGDASIEAARFFDRDLFNHLDGYDEELTGPEDWDLHERAMRGGARVARSVGGIRHDEGRLQLSELAAKKFYYGKTMGLYVKRHRVAARGQLRLLRPAFVRQWRRLAKDPVGASGMVLMKMVEATAGTAGLVAGRLR
jgi:glycosyltransferase involved in cell wall biosynthesis